MALEKITTSEGLRIYVESMPHREITSLKACVGVGSVNESKKNAGISHALEHIVHDSTELFPDEKSLNEFTGIHSLYANAHTNYTQTVYDSIGPYVKPAVKRVGELLFRATFDPQFVPNELSTVNREIYERRENAEMVHGVGADYAFFGMPYGRAIGGHPDQLDFSIEQLKEFYGRHYVPSNMALVAVGNVRIEELLKHVDRFFDHNPSSKPSSKTPAPFNAGVDTVGLRVDGYETASVRYGVPMDKHIVKKYLDNKLLFETAMQAIGELTFLRFRTETGLSYDASTYVFDHNSPKAWSLAGNATVDPGKVKKTRALFQEIFNTTSDEYSDKAIASAIGTSHSATLSMMDSVEQIADIYVEELSLGTEPTDLREQIQAIHDLEPETVRNTIDEIVEYFNNQAPITHITGPKKAVKSADTLIDLATIS